MALIAAIATAAAAMGAALALDGFTVGELEVGPTFYALALVPGLVAVALGRRPPSVRMPPLPAAASQGLGFALFAVGAAVATEMAPEGAGTAVTTAAGLAVVGLSLWWPLPSSMRTSVALAVIALLRPDAEPGDTVVLAFTGVAAAVALVACNRLVAFDHPALELGDRGPRPGRLATSAALVAVVLLLGALLASALQQDETGSGADQTRAGGSPERQAEQQRAPLDHQDVLDAGGPAAQPQGSDPDQVLLKVRAERAGVLRAITYDRWDGRVWRRDIQSRSTSGGIVAVAQIAQLDMRFLQRSTPTGSEQRIRVEAPYASVAVGTPLVYFYKLPGGAVAGVDGTVRLTPPLGKGAVYTAQTFRVDATSEELRVAGIEGVEHLEPTGLSERAQALAERVTSGAPTAYDKVAALSDHLAGTVTLADDAPPLAPDVDPIDSVLFGERTSSPERLATTLAVLVRSVGIPSRLAVGFLPGERPILGGDFVVRGRHAHAWVEVPFDGVGWQRFDPSGRIARAEAQDSLWSRLHRFLVRYWPFLAVAALVIAGLVARRMVLHRRRLAAIPWVTLYFARLVRLGAKRGRPRTPSETPAEYAIALAEGVLADERFVEVGSVVTEAAWSGRQPGESTQRWAETVLEEAADASKPKRRLRPRSSV